MRILVQFGWIHIVLILDLLHMYSSGCAALAGSIIYEQQKQQQHLVLVLMMNPDIMTAMKLMLLMMTIMNLTTVVCKGYLQRMQ